MLTRKLIMIMLMLAVLTVTTAQDDDSDACPVVVQDTVVLVSELCDGIARNEVCYGNLSLLAEPQPDVDDLDFDEPGDIEALSRIASLTLAPVNVDIPEWGVALMKVQALLPNTLPGQNVTILLFGDVELRNAVAPGDETLAPMQAFYFQSGIGTTQCAATPTDGILIRTTGSTEKVALKINDVTFTLGSTMFFQAQSEDALYMHLLDGESIISVFDETQTLQPGETLAVPLSETLSAAGPPSAPQATDPELAAGLSNVLEMLSVGEPFHLDVSGCNNVGGNQAVVPAGQIILANTWPGCWHAEDIPRAKEITEVSLTVDDAPATFIGLGGIGDCAVEDKGQNYPAYFEFGPLEAGVYTVRTVHSNPGGLMTGPDYAYDGPHYWTEWCEITVE